MSKRDADHTLLADLLIVLFIIGAIIFCAVGDGAEWKPSISHSLERVFTGNKSFTGKQWQQKYKETKK